MPQESLKKVGVQVGCRAGGKGRGLQKEGDSRGAREHLLEVSIPVERVRRCSVCTWLLPEELIGILQKSQCY